MIKILPLTTFVLSALITAMTFSSVSANEYKLPPPPPNSPYLNDRPADRARIRSHMSSPRPIYQMSAPLPQTGSTTYKAPFYRPEYHINGTGGLTYNSGHPHTVIGTLSRFANVTPVIGPIVGAYHYIHGGFNPLMEQVTPCRMYQVIHHEYGPSTQVCTSR